MTKQELDRLDSKIDGKMGDPFNPGTVEWHGDHHNRTYDRHLSSWRSRPVITDHHRMMAAARYGHAIVAERPGNEIGKALLVGYDLPYPQVPVQHQDNGYASAEAWIHPGPAPTMPFEGVFGIPAPPGYLMQHPNVPIKHHTEVAKNEAFVELRKRKSGRLTDKILSFTELDHHYRLSKMSIGDKMASASILICVATDLERTSLAKIIKMSEDLHVEDRDVKVIKIGFSLDFRHVIVLAQPSDRGMIPMYSMTKLLVGMLPNLKYAFKTGSCSACLDMGTIVIGTRDASGLVCKDPCSEQDWMVGPGLPSESLIQASFQAEEGLKFHRSPVQTGPKYLTEPSALPFEWEYGGFLSGLSRTGFMGGGNQVGQVSVVSDNYKIPSLDVISPIDAMDNLVKFWKTFFSTI